jgi:transketolase
MALRHARSSSRVFALVGDGECNEGSIWEGALVAAHHGLGNLTCVVDHNHSTDAAVSLGDLQAKFRSFGWDTAQVNGHDQQALCRALTMCSSGKPVAVICETVKGHGCRRMEAEPGAYHHGSPRPAELAEILVELS